jgi:type II secretory pathway component PulC
MPKQKKCYKVALMLCVLLGLVIGSSNGDEIDPFKPFITAPMTAAPQIKLKGIIWGEGTRLALAEDSNGKALILKTGDIIGLWRVKSIKEDMVIIEERYMDVYEGLNIRIKELTLPKKKKEVISP